MTAVACACGCGTVIDPIGKRGKPVRFVFGHHGPMAHGKGPERVTRATKRQALVIGLDPDVLRAIDDHRRLATAMRGRHISRSEVIGATLRHVAANGGLRG